MRTVFFGTPRFAAEVLSYLLSQGVSIQAVVTKPDKRVGRSKDVVPTPVKQVALAHSIPLFQPEIVSDPGFAPVLEEFRPDLFVVVAYGEILKMHLLEMPKLGCINLHASLLPKFRGAAPIQRAIMEGEKESGVTIMHMAKKMDAGDVIETVSVPIDANMSYGELEKALCDSGKELLLKVIRDFERGDIKRFPQDHSLATYAGKIELEDCEIDWRKDSLTVHNLIRSVNPEPGAWTNLSTKQGEKRLRIFRTHIADHVSSNSPGTVYLSNGKILADCGLGALELLEVQLEGKKKMSAQELFRGLSESPWFCKPSAQ